ncbi:hypothetical protein L596_030517 [Steinernema carpocapsae]|uniref:Uncharacterized protein n=1 Tax=Steinernema carpocapsae TaxID=34508 RepID=A0A4U5LPM9_STECR|nr:hypothetical protein L596_030517 [Steinernema carpocapsae]
MVRTEFLLSGALYMTLSVIVFVINLMLLIVSQNWATDRFKQGFQTLCRHKEFSSITYGIIKNICIASMTQLFSFFIGGIMTLLESNINDLLEKVSL